MSRKFNKSYYEHDERTSGSTHNIRKVSFMNGSGRIRKNKKPQQILVKYIGDDDVDMAGTERDRKPWRNNGRRNNNGRPNSPVVRNINLKPLRPGTWYQVRVIYAAKYGQKKVLQLLLSKLSPLVFIPYSLHIIGKDILFYLDDFDVANRIRALNRTTRFEDGYLLETRVREFFPPSVPVNDKLKEKMKLVMAKRYIAENKALDLSNFHADQDFKGEFYCPLARSPILRAAFQIIGENISDLVALNLNNNRIQSIEDTLELEVKNLKNLKILHFQDNKIKSIHALNCFRDLPLTELVLKGNPVVTNFKDNAHYVRYARGVAEIRKKFPKLVKLDDIELPPVISFDVSDEAKLPPPQPAFMCNPEGRGIVTAFLQQYFAIYDSDNRLDLAQAYHDNSSFSLCSCYPPNYKNANNDKLNNIYFQDNRNLFRVKDYPRRKSKLYMGKQKIVQHLSDLPKSQHDLSSFAVDLTLFTPALINLVVNGVFRERSTTTSANLWPVRHFSRNFLVVPVGQGFCIINEMLFVTVASEDEIENSFTDPAPVAAPQPGPSGTPTAPLDDSVRLQMVHTLATQTGMNLDWSKKCLDETQWNFDRAIWTFTELQSKGSIPAEAFVK